MISAAVNVVTKFLYYGISGFTSKKIDVTPREVFDEELTQAMEAIIAGIGDDDLDYSEPSRLLPPFSSYLSTYDGPIKSRSEFIEALLVSLNNIGQEITSIVPKSTVETSIDPINPLNKNIVIGHLKWDIDTLTSLVYPICMDLLKDGFIYRPDTNSFVITTRIKV